MILDKQEQDQINHGWTKVMIIWIAMLASLGIYLAVCRFAGNQIPVSMEGARLEVFKYALFGISAVTLAGTWLFRKVLMKKFARPGVKTDTNKSGNHPAVIKYLTMIIIILALSESIGIYGMVLFFVSKDTLSLYQLMAISAFAMIGFGPKKAELIKVAENMKSGQAH